MTMKAGTPDVTAIVVTYNCAEFIDRTLESLAATEGVRVQVVVVDNDSSDNTREVVRNRAPSAQLVALAANVGFAEANNVGARKAQGRYLLLLNPDAWVERDSIARMVEIMDAAADIGVLGTTVLHPDGTIQEAGNQLDRLGFPVPLRPSESRGLARNIFFASGCGFMTRRDDWERLGGLDGRLFMFCEEVDYCWRVQLSGKDIAIADEITIWHAGGATLAGGYAKDGSRHTTNPRRIYLRERNTLAMFLSNASLVGLAGMAMAWIMNVPEALGFVAMGRRDLARQYPRALAWNMRHLRETRRRRRQVQSMAIRPHRHVGGWARGSGKLRLLRSSGIPSTTDRP